MHIERPSAKGLAGSLGAEVVGLDLADLETSNLSRIRDLVRAHLVCLFPGQNLSSSQHLELGRKLGTVQTHAYHADVDGPVPEMLVMRNSRPIADFWHADETYEARPPNFSILRMVECPETGGDTVWSNQYLAYRALSASFRRLVDELTAEHVTPDGDQRAVHPVVMKHPETGRPALYVNRQFARSITGVTSVESQAVLDVLFEAAERIDFQVRYRWSPGTVAIWDNRCTQHRVIGDYDSMRHAERIAVI